MKLNTADDNSLTPALELQGNAYELFETLQTCQETEEKLKKGLQMHGLIS